jgi:divalent metal cation (Fe/Co/Zn/Cd) transporter
MMDFYYPNIAWLCLHREVFERLAQYKMDHGIPTWEQALERLLDLEAWAGWPMLAAVAYTAIPSVFLGRRKLKLAPELHDKILHADAEMMKADWIAESGTAAGVIGVGLGFWWMDPVAAALVSTSILKDGVQNVGSAIAGLIERRPMKTDQSGPDPIVEQLRAHMEGLDWVEHAEVRLREVGHVFFGEVFVVPSRLDDDLPARIRDAVEQATSTNWRLHDITVTVIDRARAAQWLRPTA